MIKIFSWNVNGIRAVVRKEMWEPFIAEHQPDILCVQETKAQPEDITLEMPGYHQYWNSAVKKGYSSTALFSKIEPLGVKNGLPEDIIAKYDMADAYGDPNTEGRVISAEFEKFFVVTVYTPNAKDDLSRVPLRHKHWDPAFLEYCKQLEAIKPVVFCGDLNVAHTEDDLARPKPNVGKKGFTAEEREGFQNFVNQGFVDTFRLFTKGNGYYTWWSNFGGARANNVGWRIDYFLVSESLKDEVTGAEIHPQVMGSDHCPVSVTLAL
jgi:exodeoxyribonuclease III